MGNWPEGVLQSCETNRTDHDKRGRRSWSLGHGRGSGVGQCNRSLTCCVRDITQVHTYNTVTVQYNTERKSGGRERVACYKGTKCTRSETGPGKGRGAPNKIRMSVHFQFIFFAVASSAAPSSSSSSSHHIAAVVQ